METLTDFLQEEVLPEFNPFVQDVNKKVYEKTLPPAMSHSSQNGANQLSQSFVEPFRPNIGGSVKQFSSWAWDILTMPFKPIRSAYGW